MKNWISELPIQQGNTSRHKLYREAQRLRIFLNRLMLTPVLSLRKKRYDQIWPTQIKAHKGTHPLRRKIAIYLLYQPNGLKDYNFQTIKFLTKNGYSVVAVNNCPVRQEDIEALSGLTAFSMERPNYGYDSGGYRDGYKFIRERTDNIESLVFINDSILWPLNPADRSLKEFETSEHFLNGLIFKSKPKDDKGAIDQINGFIEAYFYQVNIANADQLKKLDHIWQKLPMTIDRNFLREKLFSKRVRSYGFSISRKRSRKNFLEAVDELSDIELIKSLQYSGSEAATDFYDRFQVTQEFKRGKALRIIKQACNAGPFHTLFPYAAQLTLGVTHLKRNLSPGALSLRAYIAAVENGDLPDCGPILRREIQNRIDLSGSA